MTTAAISACAVNMIAWLFFDQMRKNFLSGFMSINRGAEDAPRNFHADRAKLLDHAGPLDIAVSA
jgi:hypothetical protein